MLNARSITLNTLCTSKERFNFIFVEREVTSTHSFSVFEVEQEVSLQSEVSIHINWNKSNWPTNILSLNFRIEVTIPPPPTTGQSSWNYQNDLTSSYLQLQKFVSNEQRNI